MLDVATVLTIYGIETIYLVPMQMAGAKVATVLTVYDIETHFFQCALRYS